MTEPQQPTPQALTPEHVADLQKQLADAAAQVAKVQSELQGAAGAAGVAPVVFHPHHDPMVFLNGQQFGTGPGQVNLDQILGADRATQVRNVMAQFAGGSGSFSNLSSVLGVGGDTTPPPPAAPLERLADPPRKVPTAYLLASLSFSAWETFAVFMAVVAPIALWMTVPATIPAALIIGLTIAIVLRGRRDSTRLALLRWGKVATVTNSDEISRGSYYSGTTYQNVVIPQAHGWDVDRSLYSGPASVTEIKFSVDDADGSFKLHGQEYAGGVILANPRKPSQVLCVSSFPYDLKPDADGNFPGKLAIKTYIGIAWTIVMYAALLFFAGLSMYEVWFLGHGGINS